MKKRIMAKTSRFCSKNLIVIHLIVLLFALLLFLPGCEGFIATSSSKIDIGDTSNNSTKDSSTETTKANNGETTQTSNSDESTSSTDNNSTTETTISGLTIKVYYANADGSALVAEERILQGSYKYLEAFLELIKPPITPGLIKLVPETTKVNKLTVKNGNIDLDLSKNVIDDRFKSDLTDILLVHSIVNTLTEFKEINTVTFYIDGKKGTALGQLDISTPIFRDESLIQKN